MTTYFVIITTHLLGILVGFAVGEVTITKEDDDITLSDRDILELKTVNLVLCILFSWLWLIVVLLLAQYYAVSREVLNLIQKYNRQKVKKL